MKSQKSYGPPLKIQRRDFSSAITAAGVQVIFHDAFPQWQTRLWKMYFRKNSLLWIFPGCHLRLFLDALNLSSVLVRSALRSSQILVLDSLATCTNVMCFHNYQVNSVKILIEMNFEKLHIHSPKIWSDLLMKTGKLQILALTGPWITVYARIQHNSERALETSNMCSNSKGCYRVVRWSEPFRSHCVICST